MRLVTAKTVWPIAMLVFLVGTGCATVRTAANSVASSHVSNTTQGIAADELKPSVCDSLSLTAVYQGTGDVDGGTSNDLVLGGSGGQRLRGRDGNDCVVGGVGVDQLEGEAGTDVCVGRGDTTFTTCETIICSGEKAVSVGNNFFSPTTVTIGRGCAVRWTATTTRFHNSTSNPAGTWASGNFKSPDSYAYTFNTPGTYNYRCTIHSGQTGTVIVQ